MLEKIRALFSDSTTDTGDSEAALHLAVAVLLVEVAKSDQSIDDAEVLRLRTTLKNDWQLDDSGLDGLVDVARDTADTYESLQQYVDLINRNFSPERKLSLMRGLWQAACADGQILPCEEQLIERLAGLLQVSQEESVRCMHWVLGSQGDEGE